MIRTEAEHLAALAESYAKDAPAPTFGRANPPPFHGTGKQRLIVSVSGGKDSTATLLYLRELGLPFRAVTFDTGWEHRGTYEYLDYLRRTLGIEIESFARFPKKWSDTLEATRPCVPVRTMLDWASTTHGGRQVDLLAGLPSGEGCLQWGLCET